MNKRAKIYMISKDKREDRAIESLIVSLLRKVDAEEVNIEGLPELTSKEKEALDSLGENFINDLIVGKLKSEKKIQKDT